MHLNQVLMGSKAEEYSNENCRIGKDNQYPRDEGDGSPVRSRACKRLKHAENSESKQAFSEEYQDSKCFQGPDDNTSCSDGVSKANQVSGSNQINSDRRNISSGSVSVSLSGAKGSGIGESVEMFGCSEIRASKDADISETLSQCCMENDDLSLTKEGELGKKYPADKDSLKTSTAEVSLRTCPKSEADTDTENDVGDAKVGDEKHPAHDGLHDKAEDLVKSPGRLVPQSEAERPQPEDDSDESDFVEHDVKVCDICGDSGREDLLAICCRCSDGAEHTYCMRGMLEKLPEGDWFCEECQETANQKLDLEEKKSHKVGSTSQNSGKRPSESVEVGAAAKRRALESSTGSPKASSPRRLIPLSRESSFKGLDNGKVKPSQPTSVRNRPGSDGTKLARSLSTAPRSQTSRSKLLKSNSFNNFSSKPRVKLDDVVPPKQKGGGEHVSKNIETPAGTIGKSLSFKPSNLGRATESKVKMLSSKPEITQDLKGSRHAKESGVFERKSLSRIDRPLLCSTMATSVVSTSKGDQKLTPRGETAKPSAVKNNREFKVNKDGKLSSLSKPNNISNKSSVPQVISDRTPTSLYETQRDGLPQSQETGNQLDDTRDSFSDRSRSGTNASKRPFCHKCKDFSHATDCCTLGCVPEFGAEGSVTATNSSNEMHKGNKLRAAIQAALLRRPEIHKKKDTLDQADELPTSGTVLKCEVGSQDQVLVSKKSKNNISSGETNAKQEILENSTCETSKFSSANELKQLKTDLAISSVTSRMSVIPEYKYIWQGVFEVLRSGKPPDLYTGIQAHLSSLASPKVLDVVNRFLPEVSLQEVSRLSTWPSQFHQGGAKEDNIALYFFAKDIESYERQYKGLLDHMIRNDLALKGSFDGVELLIYTSNQLPENSQRWNMLFFLWGVFRGRRINHSNSTTKIPIPSLNVMPNEKDFPTAVMTLSETRCSPTRMGEESIACGKACSGLLPSTSIDQGCIMVGRNFDIKETISDKTHLGSQISHGTQDSTRVNTKCTTKIPTSSIELSQEMNSTGSSLKGSVSEHGPQRESKPCEEAVTSVSSTTVETKANYVISCKQESSLSSRIPYVANGEIATANNDENQRRPKRKQIEDDLDINTEATFQEELPNDEMVQDMDISDTETEASTVNCQKLPWNKVNGKLEDTESSSKLQTDFSGIYGYNSSEARAAFNGNFASHVNDFASRSSVEDKGCKETCDEKIIHEDPGTMERTFFPADTHTKNDSRLVLNSMSHEYGNKFQVGVPNLELALGGETKQSQKGMLPFFAGAVDKTPDSLEVEKEDDTVAASLSLSLSFPSSNKEHIKPASKAEHLPDGNHMNTPLLLFGKFTDK